MLVWITVYDLSALLCGIQSQWPGPVSIVIQEHLKVWLSLRASKCIVAYLEKAKIRGVLSILICSRIQACLWFAIVPWATLNPSHWDYSKNHIKATLENLQPVDMRGSHPSDGHGLWMGPCFWNIFGAMCMQTLYISHAKYTRGSSNIGRGHWCVFIKQKMA